MRVTRVVVPSVLSAFLIALILAVMIAVAATMYRGARRRGHKAREKAQILRRVADLERRRPASRG